MMLSHALTARVVAGLVLVIVQQAQALRRRAPSQRSCPVCPNDQYTCEEWIQWDPSRYTCENMESDRGCDCSGCPSCPGNPSPSPPPPQSLCSGRVTLIPEARSMEEGSEVDVRAVVTAVLPGLSGYYVQEAGQGDNDASTSDGIFVYDRSASVEQGQLVVITATTSQSEDGNMQLNPQGMLVCGTSPIPAPVVLEQLPTRGEAEEVFAPLQGMLISMAGPVTATGLFYLPRYGEIRLTSGSRRYVVSQIADPLDLEGYDAVLASYRDSLIMGVGTTAQNLDPVPFPGDKLSNEEYVRGGDMFLNVTGPLGYRARGWIVDKTPGLPAPVHVPQNPRPQQPPAVGGRFTVSAFNVLNYFNGPPGGVDWADGRGANSEYEFERQKAKIVSAMVALDASVYVINEIENNGALAGSAAQDLVDGLNAAIGANTYSTVAALGEKVGTDAIWNGIIYQPGKVRVVGNPAILDHNVDPDYCAWNRPAVAVSFQELNSTADPVTVVGNHLKSKGGSCASMGDPDDPRSGNCNGCRTSASRAMVRWLPTSPTGVSSQDFLITGDMNAYRMEGPIQAFIQDGYSDLVHDFAAPGDDYSFVFIGHAGYMDHALASPSLRSRIQDAQLWHVNADESTAFHYTTSWKSQDQITEWYSPDPFRCSDHDPVIVGIN